MEVPTKYTERLQTVDCAVTIAANENARLNAENHRALLDGFTFKNPSPFSAKRLLDLCLVIPAIIFLAPFMLMTIILIKLSDGGPAIYAQERIGFGGKTFKCMKFRSMVTNSQEVLEDILKNDPAAAAEWAEDQKLRNDPRITKIGNLLRKTSLDELPQLFNVLKNDMSIVGPRPIIQDEVKRYGRFFKDYTSVKPGITGLWQVSGRNDTTYAERVRMDRLYSKRNSVTGDIAIIAKTIPAMLASKGAY